MTLELARSEGEISEQAAEREAEGEREREPWCHVPSAYQKREAEEGNTTDQRRYSKEEDEEKKQKPIDTQSSA